MDEDLIKKIQSRSMPVERVWKSVLPPLKQDWMIKRELEVLPHNSTAEDEFFSAQPPKVIYKVGTEPRELVQVVESFNHYKSMLVQIQRVNPARYKKMHKGTPYYLMGWLSYAMSDYEKAVFYMDAALSEDLANNPNWKNTPASSFLMISRDFELSAAPEIAKELRTEMDKMMRRYSRSSPNNLTTNRFVNKFIKPHAAIPEYRAIATSFNTFVLERKDRLEQIKLRSNHGGSAEPFFTHLFKGALIFESVLKRKITGRTLGDCLSNGAAQLGITNFSYRTCQNVNFRDIPSHLDRLKSDNFQERNIAIAYAIRNTAGHDLGWDDIFKHKTYSRLLSSLENSILWAINSLY